MQNYFNYYTEIEEHFQRRRGTLLILSTLDWALIATWQEAGFPVKAVLAGIDATFEKYEARKAKGRARHINGLAYCGQEVLRAMENMHAAATGAARPTKNALEESGFEAARIADHLRSASRQMESAPVPAGAKPMIEGAKSMLLELATAVERTISEGTKDSSVESLERKLVALEDQIFAALQTFTPSEKLIASREQAATELAPYRSRLQTTQIRQIEQQFLRRCLFEKYGVPRLSLFYMRQT